MRWNPWRAAGHLLEETATLQQRTPMLAEAQAFVVPKMVPRLGLEYGTTGLQMSTATMVAQQGERRQLIDDLMKLYLQCPWVNGSVDAVASTICAGGLQVKPRISLDDDEEPERPPILDRVEDLLRTINVREDGVQLSRSTLIDLQVTGDAWLEVVDDPFREPLALYSLDASTMYVDADQHGAVRGYVQSMEGNADPVTFDPEQVIHVSLDAPRGGMYGASPVLKVLLPAVAWLHTMNCIKELMRRGDPARIHVDMGKTDEKEADRWWQKYMTHNLGSKNLGTPILTLNDAKVVELSHNKLAEFLETERQLRDQIVSIITGSPHAVGIIESGNLGGGTGESQQRQFRLTKCEPLANLYLEKLNYRLMDLGFGVPDWRIAFGEVDYRDSKTVEEIRQMRHERGAYTLNEWRDEIGQPRVDGGDDPIILTRQGPVYWRDMATFTAALMDGLSKGALLAPASELPAGVQQQQPNPTVDPDDDPADKPLGPKERGPQEEADAIKSSFRRAFQHRRKRALKDLPPA